MDEYEKKMRRIKWICGTSVDDAAINIQNEGNLSLLAVCLEYEVQHQNRSTMIRKLKSRIRKLETVERRENINGRV